MTDAYYIKKRIADRYLIRVAGVTWDDLADINSLHDCDNQEEIYAACQDRLEDSGFPMELLDPE